MPPLFLLLLSVRRRLVPPRSFFFFASFPTPSFVLAAVVSIVVASFQLAAVLAGRIAVALVVGSIVLLITFFSSATKAVHGRILRIVVASPPPMPPPIALLATLSPSVFFLVIAFLFAAFGRQNAAAAFVAWHGKWIPPALLALPISLLVPPNSTRQASHMQNLRAQRLEVDHHGLVRVAVCAPAFHGHGGILELRKSLNLLFVTQVVLRASVLSANLLFEGRPGIPGRCLFHVTFIGIVSFLFVVP
mmetsp:Transcript_1344/g.3101  ORF Transcript_1344/g.3101 Transcript_1344/m.3101 type:complete len:247 (-) Transcript_1344:790-1530(-)